MASWRDRTHCASALLFAGVFGQRGAMAAAASSSAAADLPQPQMLPSSHERYKNGTRVWMVTAKREKGTQEWVTADVYRTEETNGATRVSMREVEGTEEFTVVVPHQAKASPHGQQVHKGFRFVKTVPVEQLVDEDTDSGTPRLFKLPQEVEKGVLFPLLGGDLAISLARVRTTCRLGGERVSADLLRSLIDTQLTGKGLKDIISYDLPSVGQLQRLLHIIQQSGEWAATVPIIRVAKHQGRGGGRLPIELDSADVYGVGSRAVFDGRCEALRQLSLIGHYVGVTLRRVNGEERLGGEGLTIHTPDTLPADHPYRDGYDSANPVCQIGICEYASVRDAVLLEMCWGGSVVADQLVLQDEDAPSYERLTSLATQQPPVWKCHTIGTSHLGLGTELERFYRVIVLHGDQPHHTLFEATIYIRSNPTFAHAFLYTTERPVDGKEGAATFPQTVRVARQLMGDDAVVAFGNQLDVAVDKH
ncbi:unnamed protein product [Vitrella brassicaformis CCMP3155]|uniref:Uncharacterized protein n=1 Tax=Vitrella brassicaformis (strain CCMP3155) TaxID=1169540 RepID=A0A0G4ETU0_VITBC|nr:unnamed protein product [Vitrella brassicaformis CCMP3155]|eukprot:CEM01674.1 unnamed protein product [Vitrella brassicaformis CCMP3155]